MKLLQFICLSVLQDINVIFIPNYQPQQRNYSSLQTFLNNFYLQKYYKNYTKFSNPKIAI